MNEVLKRKKRKQIYTQYINTRSICAEVGVFLGENASLILDKNPKHLYLIDLWIQPHEKQNLTANDIYEKTYQQYIPLNNVTILRKDSVQVSSLFVNEFFDFVYLDTFHNYELIHSELEAYLPKVKIGGYLAEDDYWQKTKNYGVIRAVDEIVKTKKVKSILRCKKCGQFILQRIS